MFNGKPIFGRGAKKETAKVTYTKDDFNVSEVLLENLINQEREFGAITQDQLTAVHYGIIDDNENILLEGIGDFFSSAAEFFAKMIKKFKEIIGRIFMTINAYIGSFDKFIDRYKDQLNSLDPNFTMMGHKYTFTNGVPNIDRVSAIVNSFNTEINIIDSVTKETVAKQREEFNTDVNQNKIRGEIIGVMNSVTSEDYLETVKKSYRNGSSDTIEIKVNKSVLQHTIAEYSNLKKIYTETTRQKDKVVNVIDNMKTFFSRGVNSKYSGSKRMVQVNKLRLDDDITLHKKDPIRIPEKDDNYHAINLFYNLKFLQSKEYGNMITTALIEKVNAIKEALKQSEYIIRHSLSNKGFTGADSNELSTGSK